MVTKALEINFLNQFEFPIVNNEVQYVDFMIFCAKVKIRKK